MRKEVTQQVHKSMNQTRHFKLAQHLSNDWDVVGFFRGESFAVAALSEGEENELKTTS